MSRCEDTSKLVNLVNNRKPADIYQTVADRVQAKVQQDLSSTEEMPCRNKEGEVTRTVKIFDLAKMLMDYGITRSLVKRNVMTYSYSSKRSGMQTQILEDTMRPLQLQVLAGEIPKHPFGEDGGFAVARYLSGVTYQAIVDTVKRPAVVMSYLQDIAKTMSHLDQCVYWTTPLGFPVMLRCSNTETTRVDLVLHDRGIRVRVQPRTMSECEGIDKLKARQSVSPSFVHSYDACHLMMVVLKARKEGINSVALVHDSFGCHPNYAKRFREIIKETFVELYANHNPLEQIRQENCARLVAHAHSLPDVPTQGSLDIQEVTHAEYSFA
jgi:DNA-directed RNA polymerase